MANRESLGAGEAAGQRLRSTELSLGFREIFLKPGGAPVEPYGLRERGLRRARLGARTHCEARPGVRREPGAARPREPRGLPAATPGF